jgi:hypothetical protein
MKFAVVLGRGKYADEFAGFQAEDGPRKEFVELARVLNADILSFSSASARRGAWYRFIFRRSTAWGSAFETASRFAKYKAVYVTGEDVGFRLAILAKILSVFTKRDRRSKIVCLVHNMTKSKARVLRLVGPDPFVALIPLCTAQSDILNSLGVPPEKIVKMLNWVDDQYFHPTGEKCEDYFVACGSENRDYRSLGLASSEISSTVRVFGHGFFGKNSSINQSDESAKFVLEPRVSFDSLRSAYARSRAVIVPLNDVPYAAGVTGLVEAMSMGKPIIVTDGRGISDYITSNVGIVVPPNDPIALANAIKTIESDGIPPAVGENNRKWILENCSIDNYVNKISIVMKNSIYSR